MRKPGGLFSSQSRLGILVSCCLLATVWMPGCSDKLQGCTRSGAELARERVKSRVRVEDPRMAQEEGRYQHDFTVINGNGLGLNWLKIRMVYLDRDGAEVGDWDAKFNGYIYAHDAVRKSRVDGGPVLVLANTVRYEIADARTTMRKPN